MEVSAALVASLVAAGLSQRSALATAGVSRSTWHYRTRPRPGVTEPVPHTARTAASWLTRAERNVIEVKLRAGFTRGESVYQAFYDALDAGSLSRFLCKSF